VSRDFVLNINGRDGIKLKRARMFCQLADPVLCDQTEITRPKGESLSVITGQ
jgi:hypothetical protein